MRRKKSRIAQGSERAEEAIHSGKRVIESDTRRWTPWDRRAPGLLVGAVAILTYLNALGGQFVSDATPLIANNPVLLRSRDWLVWFTRDYYWGSTLQDVTLYRPLTILSFLAHLRTTGLSPFPFLLGNVLLHAGVSLLVWRLGIRLLGPLPALAGALLFAVHPLHTEAVAWVMGRAELLAALFALAACLGFLRATDPGERRPWLFVLGAVAAYFAALLSKEHVALLPLWFALAWLLERSWRSARHAVYVGVGSALAFAVFLLMRANALTREPTIDPMLEVFNPAAVVPTPLRWLSAVAVIGRYAWLFLWPVRLSHDYSYAQIQASQGLGAAEVGGLLVILGVLGGIVLAAQRAPGVALALAFAPVTFAIVSNIPFPIGQIMNERLTYLPSVGVSLAAGWLLARLPLPAMVNRWGRPGTESARHLRPSAAGQRGAGAGAPVEADWRGWVVAGVIIGLVVALAARTVARNPDWKDDYSLYSAALQVSPRSVHVQTILSVLERARGNEARAMELVQKALETYPNSVSAILALAEIYVQRRDFPSATEHYERAVALAPRSAEIHSNLGIMLKRSGRLAEAEDRLNEAIRLAPRLSPARLALGGILLETRRPTEALHQFREAARLNPRDPVPLYGMASASLALGDRRAAETYARRAAAHGLRVPEAFWRSLRSLPEDRPPTPRAGARDGDN